jgi:general secretion pathway protein N
MKRAFAILIIVLVFIVSYVVMLPSTWIDMIVQRASHGALAMTGTTGTMWRGEGSLQALLPSGVAVTLAPLRWNIVATDLLKLKLHLKAQSLRDGRPVIDATFSPNETKLSEASLSLPAALLGVLSPTLRAADLSGEIDLHANGIRIDHGHAAGNANALWRAAGSSLSRVNPLGNYALALNGLGDKLEFRLTTTRGPLNLNGSGSWQPGNMPNIKITATPEQNARQDLVPLLRMMGREISPGTYQLELARDIKAVTP